MRSERIIASLAIAVMAAAISGCPKSVALPARPTPTPRPTVAPPRIEGRANPAYRLIVAGRARDEPARLLVLLVRAENIDDETLVLRPDWSRIELADGSTRYALDQPRALAVLKRTSPARADLYYLDDDVQPPAGGLTPTQRRQAKADLRQRMLANTRLSPGDAVEGYVVFDTGRRFSSLDGSVVELVAELADGAGAAERFSVRVLVGAPIEPGE